MTEHVPFYRWSIKDAVHQNELESWKVSYGENCACARAMEEALDEAEESGGLKPDSAAPLLERFGFDRTMWVLAATIQEDRISPEYTRSNAYWALGIRPPDESLRRDYCVRHNPGLVDELTDQVRAAWDALGLFDRSHCESETDGQLDYAGKVLALKGSVLKDRYKTPDDQLFLAESGFGCAPNARGRKVYGRFLKDGEETHFNRQDFLGILKEEHLPQWAAERLGEWNMPEETETDGIVMEP